MSVITTYGPSGVDVASGVGVSAGVSVKTGVSEASTTAASVAGLVLVANNTVCVGSLVGGVPKLPRILLPSAKTTPIHSNPARPPPIASIVRRDTAGFAAGVEG